MRRLPIYFLVDISESMVGEPIKMVEDGMRTIIQELRTDPYALETAYVSVIGFAGKAKTLNPLTELYKFYPPKFPIGSGTSLGSALNYLMDSMDREVIKNTADTKGDWEPLVFLFTDGTPTDNVQAAFDRWNNKYSKHATMVCVSIGDNADTDLFRKLTENVFRLKDPEKDSFKAFFRWVTDSIKSTSMSVLETSVEGAQLARTEGINLEKVERDLNLKIDENFVVLLAKCQNTNKPYLIKFAKRGPISKKIEDELKEIVSLPDIAQRFKLVGAYPIDDEQYKALSDGTPTNRNINTNNLIGNPTCPCCGNQYGIVVCGCGNLFCADPEDNSHCPWCGSPIELGEMDDGGADITRGRG